MIGFLGTVTGMVRAFYKMANAGSGNVDITLLSGGIYEAMITTVGGLLVGCNFPCFAKGTILEMLRILLVLALSLENKKIKKP